MRKTGSSLKTFGVNVCYYLVGVVALVLFFYLMYGIVVALTSF